jgi:hypothetical protein
MEILWKIFPWIQKKNQQKPEYSVDFRDENIYFTVNSGKYKNITVVYSNAHFFENDVSPTLKFNYRIISSEIYDEEYLQNQQDFVIILGDILQDFILEKAKNFESTRSSHT